MAEATAGCLLSAGLLRRDTGQIRDDGFVRNKAVYIALGIRPDGTKEILGIWIEQRRGRPPRAFGQQPVYLSALCQIASVLCFIRILCAGPPLRELAKT